MIINLVVILGVLTSLYAGIGSIFETDLKKLVALSTLSHLGFIAMAFGLGRTNLAFFHLCSHALFKSLLFMCVGNAISSLSHTQDVRYLSNLASRDLGSSLLISVSLFNLFGVPFLSGY